jgi:geranylgeranyl pyrophosphate synthase
VIGPDSLDAFLDAVRTRVDQALDRYLPRPPACPALISEAMRYSLFAGGKRLRPCLTLAAADAVGRRTASPAEAGGHVPPAHTTGVVSGSSRMSRQSRDDMRGVLVNRALDLALPAACAIELIHTYSLIHDDLPAMDNDTIRRGRPTLHVVYGDGIAILAGDGLQAEAFALLAREPVGDSDADGDDAVLTSRKMRVVRVIGEAARSTGLVGGQTVDLQAAGRAPGHGLTLDGDGLRAMHAQKTGALIRAAAISGAIMAGADEDTVDAVDRYAVDLGLAFQIVDDILDVEGSEHELGKTAGKDASAAKPTYPSVFGIARSRALAADCIARAQQTLADARLTHGWLAPMADWVLTRRN